MKQYWKPALSTSLALRPSKQAGPWWTPGNSRICLSAFAGGFLSPKQAVIAWNRLEAVKRVLGFGFLVWVLMGTTKEPFLKFANGKEWACEKGLLKKERAWSLLATTADEGFTLGGWSSVSDPLCFFCWPYFHDEKVVYCQQIFFSKIYERKKKPQETSFVLYA